jgi:hypothetical protein
MSWVRDHNGWVDNATMHSYVWFVLLICNAASCATSLYKFHTWHSLSYAKPAMKGQKHTMRCQKQWRLTEIMENLFPTVLGSTTIHQ